MRVLLPSSPLYGHVAPLASIGQALADSGHEVTLLTGSAFAELAERHGLGFRALPDADTEAVTDGYARRSTGVGRRFRVVQGREEVLARFVRPLEAQHEALVDALATEPWDAVLADTAYLGAVPLALTGCPPDRVPVLGVSVTPLSLVSDDVAPFGSALPPATSGWGRRRNRRIRRLLRHGPLRELYAGYDAALARHGVPRGTADYFDHAAAFDLTFHLAPAEMEYPRHNLPPGIRFVGPLPAPGRPGPLPDWWGDLDHALRGERPVVHVTQGTVDNSDLDRLLVPAVRALADEPVLTVVSTGSLPTSSLYAALGPDVPANLRIAGLLPYDAFLPHADVVVTNGGFGGVMQALRHGVPLVVAGATQDKPEVAARVQWAGVGLDLRTGTPTARRIRDAVRTVLGDPTWAQNARRVSQAIDGLGDPRQAIVEAVEKAVAVGARR